MAQVLNLHLLHLSLRRPSAPSPPRRSPSIPLIHNNEGVLHRNENPPSRWPALQAELKSRGRFSCLFSDGRKQEQARKALEGALGGKKSQFEKWDQEIKKREEASGGGGSGGGWFGGGGWFNWFNNEHFWGEAQQAILAILGIIFILLLLAKGNLMFALVFNSLLFVLRGTRNGFSFMLSRIPFKTPSIPASDQVVNETFQPKKSAKDSVVSKWGAD